MLEIKSNSDHLTRLNLINHEVYDDQPTACPKCQSTRIAGMEILGAYIGALLWECEDCKIRMLRFSAMDTAELLDRANDLFFDMDKEYHA